MNIVYLPEGHASLESFLSSLEQEEDCLEPPCWVGDTSAMWSGTSTANKLSRHASGTDCLTTPQSSETSESSCKEVQRKPMPGALTCSARASLDPANHFHQQENAREQTTNAICGPRPSSASASLGQPIAFLKMCPDFCQPATLFATNAGSQNYIGTLPEKDGYAARAGLRWVKPQLTLFGTSEPFSETWPKAGMMRAGAFYPQPSWERRIDVTDCGLWPTPNVPNGGRVVPEDAEWHGMTTAYKQDGKKMQVGLESAVRKWPTPQAMDGSRGPDARDRPGSGGPNLLSVVQTFPSPAQRDWRSGKGRQDNEHTPQLPEVVGGQLNPTWVSLLMGWPLGWVALDPMDRDEFEAWRRGFLGEPNDSRYGTQPWISGEWEANIPRVTTGAPDRVNQLKALGNGQVPIVAAVAWLLLTEDW